MVENQFWLNNCRGEAVGSVIDNEYWNFSDYQVQALRRIADRSKRLLLDALFEHKVKHPLTPRSHGPFQFTAEDDEGFYHRYVIGLKSIEAYDRMMERK